MIDRQNTIDEVNEITMVEIEMINPKEIKTHQHFEDLFPIKLELLEKIEEGMKEWEYDKSQPIIVGTWEGQDEPVCIDGHTRLLAALNVGITEVPVYEYEYDDEETAIEHAIMLQCHRRNLSDAELLHFIEMLDRPSVLHRNENGKFAGAPNGAAGKSAEATGKLLGISGRKVERGRTIIDHGDPEIVEAVKNGEMSVNKGYEETQKKRKKLQSTSKPSEKKRSGDSFSAPDDDETSSEHEQTMMVGLRSHHYEALQALGGAVEDHVARAVDRYLWMLEHED